MKLINEIKPEHDGRIYAVHDTNRKHDVCISAADMERAEFDYCVISRDQGHAWGGVTVRRYRGLVGK